MNSPQLDSHAASADEADFDDGPQIGLLDLLTWVGEGKRRIAVVTGAVAVISLLWSVFMMPVYFTARATLLPPGSQQQSGSGAALAALGALGGLAGGLGAKTPDELYVSLLRSDSVQRALAEQFDLKKRYDVETYEVLRKKMPQFIRINSDRKSGLITVEVDDTDPAFAAKLANAHAGEVSKVLGRLAVSEAQSRRAFFEQQLKATKEHLVLAEVAMRKVQEQSGVIVLDKQAEALIGGAATIRAQIAEREVQMKVLRTAATDQNPDVMRLSSELRGLRSELARLESRQGGAEGSAVDIPVGKLPAAAIDYVRARREVKLQETLLESMIRQYEVAKLDEAKEGPQLQEVDAALPPDRKSKPQRAIIVLVSTLLALLCMALWAIWRGYARLVRVNNPEVGEAWAGVTRAWRFRA
jgi:tyrosine-protein kinase Etk/Wzc